MNSNNNGPQGPKESVTETVTKPTAPDKDTQALTLRTGKAIGQVLNDDEQGTVDDGEALAEANPLAQQIALLRALFKDAEGVEARIYGTVESLALEVEDPQKAALWMAAMERAGNFDGKMVLYSDGSSNDGATLQILTGERDSGRLSVWKTNAKRHLEEIILRSTFAKYSNPGELRRAFAEAASGRQLSDMFLVDAARHIRSLGQNKLFETVVSRILAEREKRLMAKYNLRRPDQFIPQHYWDNPWWEHVTLDQLQAYLAGDRSDKVFSIEKPEEERPATKGDLTKGAPRLKDKGGLYEV